MYSTSKNSEVSLWAEYKEADSEDEEETVCYKKPRKSNGTKRQSIEEEVDNVYADLFAKHGDAGSYSIPRLKLLE